MKFIRNLASEKSARHAAQFMKYVCYFIILFSVFCMVLSFMGRQSFWLYAKNGSFEHAIYAEEEHAAYARSMTVHLSDTIHVWTNENDQIELITQVGLSVVYAVQTLPLILAYWLLSRVFSSIQDGQIFTDKNADYLLYYGLLLLFVAVLVPFIKLFVCWLITAVSGNRVEITTGQGMFSSLVQSIAFLVAAYIIHYGIHLQDEVNHTL